MAKVVVRRNMSPFGGARRITVAIDRKVVCELHAGGRFEMDIEPGWYGVEAEWARGKRSASFDNKDGSPVEIIVGLPSMSLGKRPTISISVGE